MKYLKTYEEETTDQPEEGDYVVVTIKNNSKIGKLLERTIGKIVRRSISTTTETPVYIVKFGTVDFRINREEILDFSKNKKDLEKYILAKKFNI